MLISCRLVIWLAKQHATNMSFSNGLDSFITLVIILCKISLSKMSLRHNGGNYGEGYISKGCRPWWRHQMETFSALLALCAGNSPVTGEIPSQRPVTRSFDVFFDLRLNKRLSQQPWGWWFETPWRSLWRHYNAFTKLVHGITMYGNTLSQIIRLLIS